MSEPESKPESTTTRDDELRDRLAAIVGAKAVLADAAAMEPHLVEQRGRWRWSSRLTPRRSPG